MKFVKFLNCLISILAILAFIPVAVLAFTAHKAITDNSYQMHSDFLNRLFASPVMYLWISVALVSLALLLLLIRSFLLRTQKKRRLKDLCIPNEHGEILLAAESLEQVVEGLVKAEPGLLFHSAECEVNKLKEGKKQYARNMRVKVEAAFSPQLYLDSLAYTQAHKQYFPTIANDYAADSEEAAYLYATHSEIETQARAEGLTDSTLAKTSKTKKPDRHVSTSDTELSEYAQRSAEEEIRAVAPPHAEQALEQAEHADKAKEELTPSLVSDATVSEHSTFVEEEVEAEKELSLHGAEDLCSVALQSPVSAGPNIRSMAEHLTAELRSSLENFSGIPVESLKLHLLLASAEELEEATEHDKNSKRAKNARLR